MFVIFLCRQKASHSSDITELVIRSVKESTPNPHTVNSNFATEA